MTGTVFFFFFFFFFNSFFCKLAEPVGQVIFVPNFPAPAEPVVYPTEGCRFLVWRSWPGPTSMVLICFWSLVWTGFCDVLLIQISFDGLLLDVDRCVWTKTMDDQTSQTFDPQDVYQMIFLGSQLRKQSNSFEFQSSVLKDFSHRSPKKCRRKR